MLFSYTAIDKNGKETSGSIEAYSEDVAIAALQRRGFVISSIRGDEEKAFFQKDIGLFEHVSNRDIVILSRQIATLFEAEVSALRVFRLLAEETESPLLRRTLSAVGEDLAGGSPISRALAKYPKVFSSFYVNMVKAGEESGKLNETFLYLADYLDRSYEVTSNARNALIYPAFVIVTFIGVMTLMLTTVIPRLAGVLEESGQPIPPYTKVVITLSDILVNYGVFVLILLIVGGFFLWRHSKTSRGALALSHFKLSLPYIGTLYRKLYLSRIADNLNAKLGTGMPMVRTLVLSASVTGRTI